MKLFKKRCNHYWEIKQEFNILHSDTRRIVGYLSILRCKHCGDIKHKKFYL